MTKIIFQDGPEPDEAVSIRDSNIGRSNLFLNLDEKRSCACFGRRALIRFSGGDNRGARFGLDESQGEGLENTARGPDRFRGGSERVQQRPISNFGWAFGLRTCAARPCPTSSQVCQGARSCPELTRLFQRTRNRT